MSESIVNIKERSEEGVSEEDIDVALSLPDKVYDANTRDDIPDDIEAEDGTKPEETGIENNVTSYALFEEEQSYESPQGDLDAGLEKRIELFKLSKLHEVGSKTLKFVRKTRKVA